jgi:hypothetical protein
MELGNQLEVSASQPLVDARRCPRYKLNIEIRIYPRNCPVVRGHTVDISESGISAMLLVEVPVGEVIRLEFSLPFGDVQVHAMVRQRLAFRYGFSSSRPVPPRTSSVALVANWRSSRPLRDATVSSENFLLPVIPSVFLRLYILETHRRFQSG